jgi:glycogen operon protein
VGDGGYQVGNFPPLWSEWNGKYRDSVRDYWRAAGTSIGELAERLTGSSDLYEATGRRPFASINFVTCHDGFTLRDLTSYNMKHNEANAEGGRDGSDDNRSWNCGVEGRTDDPAVNALRARQQRNLLATLLLSQGVPMLLGGDEFGRTQQGNNNAYCQDNEISWFDWADVDADLLEWTRAVIGLRTNHPVFRRRRFFRGRVARSEGRLPDIAWLRPEGGEMTDADWGVGYAKSLAVWFNGSSIPEPDRHGRPILDQSFYLCFNSWEQPLEFLLPPVGWGVTWEVVVDTADDAVTRSATAGPRFKAGDPVPLQGHHFVALRGPGPAAVDAQEQVS